MVDVKFNRDRPQTHCGGEKKGEDSAEEGEGEEAEAAGAAVTESNPAFNVDVFHVFNPSHTQKTHPSTPPFFPLSGLCVGEARAPQKKKKNPASTSENEACAEK